MCAGTMLMMSAALAPDDVEAIGEALAQLIAQQPALTRELLAGSNGVDDDEGADADEPEGGAAGRDH